MPSEIDERYSQMLNDSLDLGVNYGIFAFWGYWFVALGLIIFWWRNRKLSEPWRGLLAGAVGAWGGYLICASFTAMYGRSQLYWFSGGLLVVLVGGAILGVVRYKLSFKYRDLLWAVLAALIPAAAVLSYGRIFEHSRLPLVHEQHNIMLSSGTALVENISYEMRPKALVVFLFDDFRRDNYFYFVRNYGRELARDGYWVSGICVDSGLYGRQDALELLNKLREPFEPDLPCFVAGVSEQGALVAPDLAVASGDISGLITVDCVAEDLTEFCAINSYCGPWLVIGTTGYGDEADNLSEIRRSGGFEVTRVQIDDIFRKREIEREVGREISSFIKNFEPQFQESKGPEK